MKIDIRDNQFELFPEKYLIHAQSQTLIVSDLHLGKASHFQKNGIPLTTATDKLDLIKLKKIVNKTPTIKRLIILGDLFHAGRSKSDFILKEILQSLDIQKSILVMGNHDRFSNDYYRELGFDEIKSNYSLTDNIHLTHTPEEDPKKFNISGHIHPGYKLSIGSKVKKLYSCFWRKENQLILPAFGSLTGNYSIRPKQGNTLYLIEDNVIQEFEINK